jgi:uncharacterized phiE125 gp8 family phage protein
MVLTDSAQFPEKYIYDRPAFNAQSEKINNYPRIKLVAEGFVHNPGETPVAVSEPVTTTEIKNFLRIDVTDDDTWLASLIKASRKKCEQYTNRTFYLKQFKLWMDRVPTESCLEIPYPPFNYLTEINTYSSAEVETVFASTNYSIDYDSEPGRVFLKVDKTWPTDLRNYNAFEMEFFAGYDAPATSCPEDVKEAIKKLAALLFENREEGGEDLPASIKALLDPYKVRTF